VGSTLFKDPKLLLIQYLTCIIGINLTEVSALSWNLGNGAQRKQECPIKLSLYSLSQVKHA
jgi:hypothetical protein